MRIPKPILIVSIALLAIVAIGSIFAYQTAKWMLGRVHRSSIGTMNTALRLSSNPLPQPRNTSIVDEAWRPVQVGAAMSDAFDTGKFPEPSNVDASDHDSTAAELAHKVSLKDENSASALLTALKLAGLNVRGADQAILVGAKNSGQGIGFDSWEVASAAKLYADGFHTSLVNFSDAFTQSIPGFKSVPLGKLIVEGIRKDTDSKKPELRFWARFIVELGKQADPAYDLLDANLDLHNAQLDAVQFAFITKRLAADFAILGSRANNHSKTSEVKQSRNTTCSAHFLNAARPAYITPRLFDTVWHPGSQPQYIPVLFQEGGSINSKLPCNLTEGQMQLLDSMAYSFGIGFDQLMELLSKPEVLTEGGTAFVEGMSRFTLLANAALVYFKLVYTSLTLHATITMDSSPLVRDIYPVAGCRRKLRAQIIQKIGNKQIINCLRAALNFAGMDLSLPSDGPVKEVPTDWHLVEGGVNVAEAARTGMNTAIVEFVCNGPHIQDAGTYAGVAAEGHGIAIGDCIQPSTDDDGKVEVDIEGAPRKISLSGWAAPVMKTAKVQLTFAAKPPNMKQDLIDTMAAGGLIGGNPIVLLSVVAVEMTLRSRWFASPVFTVPVKDWVRCGGGWTGTITYTETEHHDSSTASETQSQSQSFDYKKTVDVVLSGNSEPNPEGLSHAVSSVNLHQETVNKGTLRQYEGDRDCSGWENDVDTQTASGSAPIDVAVSLVGNTYFVGVIGNVPTVMGHEDINDTGHWPCAGAVPQRPNLPVGTDAGFAAFGGMEDPRFPGELHGSNSGRERSGREWKIEWNLASCSQVSPGLPSVSRARFNEVEVVLRNQRGGNYHVDILFSMWCPDG
jgi:hypothetical protein